MVASHFMDILRTIPEGEINDVLPGAPSATVASFETSEDGQTIEKECGQTGCTFCNQDTVAWLLYYGFAGNGRADKESFDAKPNIHSQCPFRSRVTS